MVRVHFSAYGGTVPQEAAVLGAQLNILVGVGGKRSVSSRSYMNTRAFNLSDALVWYLSMRTFNFRDAVLHNFQARTSTINTNFG